MNYLGPCVTYEHIEDLANEVTKYQHRPTYFGPITKENQKGDKFKIYKTVAIPVLGLLYGREVLTIKKRDWN